MDRLHVLLSILCALMIIICINSGFAAGASSIRSLNLQQTVPPGNVPVCPLSTVEYTCVDDIIISWREEDSPVTAFYTTFGSIVNDTSMAGIFRTVLTDVNDGDKLTSTATIDRVSLEDDGRNISCGGISALSWQQLHVEGAPPAPSNVVVTKLNTSPGNDHSVNLTWSQNGSLCVVVYQVEVTTANSFTSKNTTLQHAILLLQTGIVYSFRVRGIDSANRLGKWSTEFTYTAVTSSSTIMKPTMTLSSSNTVVLSTTPTVAMDSSGEATILFTRLSVTVTSISEVAISRSSTPTVTMMASGAGSLSVGAIIAVVFVFVLIAAVVSLVLSCTLICYKINHRVRNGDKNLHNNQQLTISLHRPVTEETGNNCAKANEQLHDVSEQIGRSSSYRAIAITADQVI